MEESNIVKYQTLTGQEVKLSPDIVKKYLVSGEGKVTEQELMMFMALCKYQNLNPFLREAYLIKYGTEKATMVVGKETFLKRAVKNPKYRGHETSISADGKKATAKVYVEGYVVPICCEVNYEEYVGKKKDGTINRMWKEKGRTMLKKVALVQALREAFPEDFGGMYSPEEINIVQMDGLSDKPIEMPAIDDVIDIESTNDKPPLKEPESKSENNDPLAKDKRTVWAKMCKITKDRVEWKKVNPSRMVAAAECPESSKDWTKKDIDKLMKYLDNILSGPQEEDLQPEQIDPVQ